MMRLEFSHSGISFYHGDKLAGVYRHNDEFKPHIHPLRTPRGHGVTSVSPHDHKHHKALMYALRVEGVNFWEEVPTLPDELTGRQKHIEFFDVVADGVEVGFSEKLHWSAIDGSRPCFDEVRRVTCRYENGDYVWTWETRLTALRPLRLIQSQWSHTLADGSKVNYHGLGIRFRRDMAGALGGATRGTELLLDGKATTGLPIEHMGRRAKEVTYIGSIDETWPVEQAGVSLRQETDHALYVLDAPFPFMALGPTNAGPLELDNSESIKDSFTIRVFDAR